MDRALFETKPIMILIMFLLHERKSARCYNLVESYLDFMSDKSIQPWELFAAFGAAVVGPTSAL